MNDLLDNSEINDINIEDTLKSSYLDYSMSVIIGRALPDVRDGLKPVHRRILYAMDKLNLSAGAKYKKSARIVGDVIGQYHPHGDTSVYDALVRMAQPFSMRAPLVDGQGNFGSVDGDNAAAMRYTEARMTRYAGELLKDLDKDTVDMVDNYDGTTQEPDVLPTRVPNLLINGSSGIAVGMATNIPPHNPQEVLQSLVYLIDNPQATLHDIMQFIKAPDFPTGGTIYGKKGILDAYETGRGRIRVRAKTHIEKKSNKDVIVIDELPYQVNKARLIETIADLVKDKFIEGISEIRDESDREGIRVVIELKRDAMSEIVLNNLYKSTNMETTFGIIMLSVFNQEPRVFTLLETLGHFINHRKTVIIRRTIFDLEKAKARAHILEGLKKALDHIEAIIKLIRASADGETAKNGLISEFGFSPIQAQAILDMRLQRLTGLERDKIENELKEILAHIEYLESILRSEEVLKTIIKDEFIELVEQYNIPRMTDIEDNYDDINIEDLIPNEPMVVTISHRGYIKRVPLAAYEKQIRGGKGKVADRHHRPRQVRLRARPVPHGAGARGGGPGRQPGACAPGQGRHDPGLPGRRHRSLGALPARIRGLLQRGGQRGRAHGGQHPHLPAPQGAGREGDLGQGRVLGAREGAAQDRGQRGVLPGALRRPADGPAHHRARAHRVPALCPGRAGAEAHGGQLGRPDPARPEPHQPLPPPGPGRAQGRGKGLHLPAPGRPTGGEGRRTGGHGPGGDDPQDQAVGLLRIRTAGPEFPAAAPAGGSGPRRAAGPPGPRGPGRSPGSGNSRPWPGGCSRRPGRRARRSRRGTPCSWPCSA